MENAPCLFTFQNFWETGGFRKPHTSAQLSVMDRGHHNGVGPGGVGKAQSAKASSIELRLSRLRQRQAAPVKSPATKSIFLDNFLGNTSFLGKNIVDVQGENGEGV